MKKARIFTILAVILVFALALSACGGEKAQETTAATAATVSTEPVAPQPLGLTDWNMSASTWSSPNGATIHLTATPNSYADGQSAAFVVRLESDEIANIPCQWDGTSYTASADLNAADGYCYFVVLTAADGTSTEVAVNTPAAPTNEAFINMEASLNSYCSVTVEKSSFDGSKLVLSGGTVQVQAPTITNDGETITCDQVVLSLSFKDQELAKEELTLSETDTAGLFSATLDNITFDIPEMEDDQQVVMVLNVTLSNGQALTAPGGNWFYTSEGLLPVVG